MQFQITSSSITMQSNLLWLSFSHGKCLCVKSKRFLVVSISVHLMCCLNLVCHHHHQNQPICTLQNQELRYSKNKIMMTTFLAREKEREMSNNRERERDEQ